MRLRPALLAWFDRHKRDLPWRRTSDPYAIWISEVMLQQTQVATVLPYWRRFLERFPDVGALAAAELPDVLAVWRGLGYYSRARNLHCAAREIVAGHGGHLPSTAAGLLELPGFGRYTAGAVASIAFGEEAPIVDGNVARVLSRVFVVEGAPGDRVRERKLWSLAEDLVRGKRPGALNQALMELGATVCRFENPACERCPIRRGCGALETNRVNELPPPRVRSARRELRLAVAVWRRGDRVLLARRRERGLFGGLWELPSVEIAKGATARVIGATLASVLGPVELGAPAGTVRRTLTHRALTLDLFHVRGRHHPPISPLVQEWRWAVAEEAAALGMSTAMDRALAVALSDASVGPATGRARRVAG